jgi:ubiquinone/menaquinone biosynthesis C-methylase UbiE
MSVKSSIPEGEKAKYIPAMGFDLLTPLYDPFVKWFMPESKFKKHLIEQARIRPGQRVLDLGCGTATLTILIKQAHPHAEVTGLDGDAKILKIARRKVARAGVEITLHEGMAYQLTYSDKSFDRVVSSLVFHHLTAEGRRRALSEAFRVLQPGGELHTPTCRQNRKSDAVNANLREKAHGERYRDGGLCGKLYNRWRVERAKNLLGEGKLSIGLNLPAAVS